MKFELAATDRTTGARLGLLTTSHGTVETPVFMPCGTQATVKTLAPRPEPEASAPAQARPQPPPPPKVGDVVEVYELEEVAPKL